MKKKVMQSSKSHHSPVAGSDIPNLNGTVMHEYTMAARSTKSHTSFHCCFGNTMPAVPAYCSQSSAGMVSGGPSSSRCMVKARSLAAAFSMSRTVPTFFSGLRMLLALRFSACGCSGKVGLTSGFNSSSSLM